MIVFLEFLFLLTFFIILIFLFEKSLLYLYKKYNYKIINSIYKWWENNIIQYDDYKKDKL